LGSARASRADFGALAEIPASISLVVSYARSWMRQQVGDHESQRFARAPVAAREARAPQQFAIRRTVVTF